MPDESRAELMIPVHAPALVWLAVAGSIKLALRHPRYTGATASIAGNFAEQVLSKLQQEGFLSADEIAESLRDDIRFENSRPRIVRDLPWIMDQGSIGEALGISDKTIKACEDLVAAAQDENWSLRRLIDTANQKLSLSDAEWSTFMYTLGWWDHMRRG